MTAEELIESCRQLNENLPDSLPYTADITTLADVWEWHSTVEDHFHAINKALTKHYLPFPSDTNGKDPA